MTPHVNYSVAGIIGCLKATSPHSCWLKDNHYLTIQKPIERIVDPFFIFGILISVRGIQKFASRVFGKVSL